MHCDFERGGVKSNANNLKAHIVGGHEVVLRKGIIVNFPGWAELGAPGIPRGPIFLDFMK